MEVFTVGLLGDFPACLVFPFDEVARPKERIGEKKTRKEAYLSRAFSCSTSLKWASVARTLWGDPTDWSGEWRLALTSAGVSDMARSSSFLRRATLALVSASVRLRL